MNCLWCFRLIDRTNYPLTLKDSLMVKYRLMLLRVVQLMMQLWSQRSRLDKDPVVVVVD